MEIIEIPNKSAFKLNEVCSITGVKPYVLRFWESEFDEIVPMTSSTGQKLYGPRDIEVIATIKDLLFNKKMSIEEARFSLNRSMNQEEDTHPSLDDEEGFEASLDDSIPPKIPSFSEDEGNYTENSLSFQRMSLSDSDLEKLVMAKSLLKDIVDFNRTL